MSSTYLCQSLGVGGSIKNFLLQVPHVKVSYNGADREPIQFFSSPSDLKKSTLVDVSLSSTTTVLFHRRNYLLLNCYNRIRNLHKIILEQHGMEALQLFRDWERLQTRDCDYRNHRIFTLRYITKDIVPISIKLKTTIWTEKLGLSEEQKGISSRQGLSSSIVS